MDVRLRIYEGGVRDGGGGGGGDGGGDGGGGSAGDRDQLRPVTH